MAYLSAAVDERIAGYERSQRRSYSTSRQPLLQLVEIGHEMTQ
jgi:hypothetical protein